MHSMSDSSSFIMKSHVITSIKPCSTLTVLVTKSLRVGAMYRSDEMSKSR
jgi:hypothetical protein